MPYKGYKAFLNIPTSAKIVIGVVVCLIVSTFIKTFNKHIEGFEQNDRFVNRDGTDIYDEFYASVYDALVFNNVKNDYEVGEIINATPPQVKVVS